MSMMSFKLVYGSLKELFPQIDERLLKAVAIEHQKNADEAAAVVTSEIVPMFYPDLVENATQPGIKINGNVSDKKVEPGVQNGALSGSETSASSSATIRVAVDHRVTRTPVKLRPKRPQLARPNGDLVIQDEAKIRLSKSIDSGVASSDTSSLDQAGTKSRQDVDFPVTANQAESSTSTVSEDAVRKLAHPEDDLVITQTSSCFQFGLETSDDVKEASRGSLDGEKNDAELSGSALDDETLKGSLGIENSDQELDEAFSSVFSRSTQGRNIDHLEQIIEDAKSNKRTLFTVMESIMNLMREVELQEKDAEKAKEEATRGGIDSFEKVEELKKILAHAKDANDMNAGEVYGERSILTTEVKELEIRLLSLSEERDKSLGVLDEMRKVLEVRQAAALAIINAAEQEKQEKEGHARKALAEQEVIMDKVVQESKLLEQEAEENSKLREFLMERGRTVDCLQGEISVICQDIRLLKEKFDNRVPLSQSISSSQTSCKLASSGSSMKNFWLEKLSEPSYETPEAAEATSKSPEAPVNEGKDKAKELLEDGWDIFDKDADL